jgi:very-short-patch-repair endonuclease
MLPYNKNIKDFSRDLRKNQTSAEKLLWDKIRKKQILGIQFYRQKPIFNYIADFYAAEAKLIIELDGKQHSIQQQNLNDRYRDEVLLQLNLKTLRFTNDQVIDNINAVLKVIIEACK